MTGLTALECDVKQTVEDLINTATNYDIDSLATIYHDSLKVIMVNQGGSVNMMSKSDFMRIFEAKRDAGDPPMNSWVQWHHIEASDTRGLVVLTRKNNLNGIDMSLFLTIDLLWESGRWQVIREVIYLQPDVSSK